MLLRSSTGWSYRTASSVFPDSLQQGIKSDLPFSVSDTTHENRSTPVFDGKGQSKSLDSPARLARLNPFTPRVPGEAIRRYLLIDTSFVFVPPTQIHEPLSSPPLVVGPNVLKEIGNWVAIGVFLIGVAIVINNLFPSIRGHIAMGVAAGLLLFVIYGVQSLRD